MFVTIDSRCLCGVLFLIARETANMMVEGITLGVKATGFIAGVDFEVDVHPNHPLYVQTSDKPGRIQISMKLTGPETYPMWCRNILVTLLGKNKMDFVDGSVKKDLFDFSPYAL